MDPKLLSIPDHQHKYKKFIPIKPLPMKRRHSSTDELLNGDENNLINGETLQPKCKRIKWSLDLKKEVISRILLTGETLAKLVRVYNLPESTIRTWLNSELGLKIKSQLELIDENQQPERKVIMRPAELKKEVLNRILIAGEARREVCRYYNLPESTVRTWIKSEMSKKMKNQTELLASENDKSADGSGNDRYEYSMDLSAVQICRNEKSDDFLQVVAEARSPIEGFVNENTKSLECKRMRRIRSDSGVSICSVSTSDIVDSQEAKKTISPVEISSMFDSPSCNKFNHSQQIDILDYEKTSIEIDLSKNSTGESSTDTSILSRYGELVDFSRLSEAKDYSPNPGESHISTNESMMEVYPSLYGNNLSACIEESIDVSTQPHSNVEDHRMLKENVIESLESEESRPRNGRNQLPERKMVVRSTELKKKVITRILVTGETKAKVSRLYKVPESTLRTWMKSELGQEIKNQLEHSKLNVNQFIDKPVEENCESPIDLSAVRICCNNKSDDISEIVKANSPSVEVFVTQGAKSRKSNLVGRTRSDSGVSVCSDTSSLNIDHPEVQNRMELFENDDSDSLTASSISSCFETPIDLSQAQANFADCRRAESRIDPLEDNVNFEILDRSSTTPHCKKYVDRLQVSKTTDHLQIQEENNISTKGLVSEDYQSLHQINSSANNGKSIVNANVIEPELNAEDHLQQELGVKMSTNGFSSVSQFGSGANLPLTSLINYCTKQLNLLLEDGSANSDEQVYIERALTRLHNSNYSKISREEIFELLQFSEKQVTVKAQRAAENSIRLYQSLMWN